MNAVTSNTTVDAGLSPYALGMLEAESGGAFAPEVYYFWFGDLLDFCEGWEAVKGEDTITRAFKAQWPQPVEEDAIENDYAWIRGGC